MKMCTSTKQMTQSHLFSKTMTEEQSEIEKDLESQQDFYLEPDVEAEIYKSQVDIEKTEEFVQSELKSDS